MQQQIQRFLEKYFENPKSPNKETIESNKPSVPNGNETTTLKEKGILQEKDKTENLDHHEDITKPVMKWATDLNKSGHTMYSRKEHIKKSVKIPSATHRSDKENIQPVGMQSVKGKNILNKRQTDNLQSDNNRFNIKENLSNHTGHTEPNEKSMMDLLCNIMNRLEIIESNQKGAEEYQTVLWKKLDRKIQKIFRNVIFDPNKEDLICLNEVLDQTWENIETAIIAAAKKTVPYLQVKKTVKAKQQKTAIAKVAIALGKLIRKVKRNRISIKCLLVEVWNNQIRHINHLAKTKVNKFPYSREDLKGWLTEVYTWRKALEGKLTTKSERVKSAEIKSFVQRYAEMIVSEQKKMLSLLERPFNKINKEEKKRLDLEGVAEARHAVLTYADNTIWIASSKKQLTQILELTNEFYQLNRIKNIWQYQDIKLDERAWHSNIAINTIKQCKNLDLIFDMVEGSWHLQENGPTIISMLDSKSEKQSKQPHIDLGLFFVRQLLNCSGRNLLTWQQIKTARGANCRDKVPLWFRKLEELLIDDTENRKVKEDFFSNDINTSALQPHCGNITSDNRRKQWIWFVQKNKKKWYLGRVTKILEKSALIEHWTKMHIQGDKCRLLKCGGCNLNTKGKKNGCMISCNKNFIRDKPKYPLTPVQECPLLQLKEIDYAEQAEWYLLKKNKRYRDEGPEEETNWFFCWENLKEIKGPKYKSEDTSNSLVTKIKGLFQVLPTKTELCITRAKKRGAEKMQSGQRANLHEPARKKRKPNNKTELQNSNIWKTLKEKLIKTKKLVCETLSKQIFSSLLSVWWIKRQQDGGQSLIW
ncbi:3182_t:CDS:2 [Gigaspora margarita]|uniref:3182_t:CDS:1 n=1 Tax=Gigaspora margarita TaxID=4874 RepID=A0ABM8VYW2_GIGMA|nr:3182_t:CDS:2 [Gigaspora margarita]